MILFVFHRQGRGMVERPRKTYRCTVREKDIRDREAEEEKKRQRREKCFVNIRVIISGMFTKSKEMLGN